MELSAIVADWKAVVADNAADTVDELWEHTAVDEESIEADSTVHIAELDMGYDTAADWVVGSWDTFFNTVTSFNVSRHRAVIYRCFTLLLSRSFLYDGHL